MNLRRVEAFFFKAMLNGWVSDAEETTLPGMPGFRAIQFREGDFYLLDRYCVTPMSSKSAGTTTIWHKDAPVWVMNYGGWCYDNAVLAVLKAALREAYAEGLFMGGRGPRIYTTDVGVVYANIPYTNDFSAFSGREVMTSDVDDQVFGYHEYWGMSLL